MFDRRRALLSAAALATLATPAAAVAPDGAAGHGPRRLRRRSAGAEGRSDPRTKAELDRQLDAAFSHILQTSPQTATMLGLDTDALAPQRGRLDDASLSFARAQLQDARGRDAALARLDRGRLKGMDLVNLDTVRYVLGSQIAGERFDYGARSSANPYVISQLTGAYQGVPDFLDTQHPVRTRDDAEAYLSRLEAFATVLDQEADTARGDAAKGVIPPDFVIEKTLVQMKALRAASPEDSTLVGSVARRAKAAGIEGDWRRRAAEIVGKSVYPALDRQMALVDSWRARATHDAGCWRLPDGGAYYAYGLKTSTTSTLSPEEVHALGLKLCKSLSARTDALMRAQGLTRGSVGERFQAMNRDPRFIYPNTDAGKAKLLADLNAKMAEVSRRLPEVFGTLPKAGLDIRRVPKEIEAGAPGGYYNQGTLDGSRPGAYYINLRDTAENASWTLPTLTYHEGSPGHHLQSTLALEAKGIPNLRKLIWFSGYGEGWALYAEQLADEMGMYRDDPWGRIGYLHDALFRAVRLVVDSGMHAKRWSREQALKFYIDAIGDPEPAAVTEIERYCVWPGQACSYMVGKIEWLRLRALAKERLGARFDIRQFHDATLLPGAMPLYVLERVVEAWIASQA